MHKSVTPLNLAMSKQPSESFYSTSEIVNKYAQAALHHLVMCANSRTHTHTR
jgi:hypothetical protein